MTQIYHAPTPETCRKSCCRAQLSAGPCSTITVPFVPKVQGGPIHLVIDSTGLKMLGDGEWHSLKHKTANKRRSWRKLHLGVDADGFIVA